MEVFDSLKGVKWSRVLRIMKDIRKNNKLILVSY